MPAEFVFDRAAHAQQFQIERTKASVYQVMVGVIKVDRGRRSSVLVISHRHVGTALLTPQLPGPEKVYGRTQESNPPQSFHQ